jgi:hypothetical protein
VNHDSREGSEGRVWDVLRLDSNLIASSAIRFKHKHKPRARDEDLSKKTLA